MRIGQGWDLHRLEKGKKLVLGGVFLDANFGTVAHSDGDVVVHAIIDALLGAASLGNIGILFPDTDPKYKNANSLDLLKVTTKMVKEAGYTINNIDSTIILQTPKISLFIKDMQKNIAESMLIELSKVSIKAKTSEKIGVVGEGLAVEAMAVVLIDEVDI